jgi:hypothetical protein
VFIVSATCVFKRINVIKIGSCYCKRKTKKKSVLCENSVINILLGSRYVLYWDGKFILLPIQMWLPPQPYRCYSFGCKYTWGGWRSSSSVFGILQLKPDAIVVMCRTISVHSFCIFCIWLLTYVSHILLYKSFFCIIL